jgi:LysM repeat protein
MTRRTPAEYDWRELEFDETILEDIPGYPRRHSSRNGMKIQFVVIHHMAMVGKGDGKANDACVRAWRTREASANYGVDGKHVRQFVWDSNGAWHSGNSTANRRSIGIEHANSTAGPKWLVGEATWLTGAKLVGFLCWKYDIGRPHAGTTVRRHRDFMSTACPGPFLGGTNYDEYVAEAARHYDRLVGAPKPEPEPTPAPAGDYYTVKAGDTLSKIAAAHGTTVDRLMAWNRDIENPNQIEVGQRIRVTAPTDTSPPAPAKLPSDILDLDDWKLTKPDATEVKQPKLDKFKDPKSFFVRGASVVFRAHCGGNGTPNSKYPRSELREMKDGGKNQAAWSSKSGTHTMRITQAITATPKKKPHVVAGQIHDKDDDVVMVRLEGKRLFVEAEGEEIGLLDPAYRLGTIFTVEVIADRTGITVSYVNGLRASAVELRKRVVTGGYFKAGCYTQSNVSKGDKAVAYGEVAVYALEVEHTA